MRHFSSSLVLPLLQPVHLTAFAFYSSFFFLSFLWISLSTCFLVLSGLCGVIEQKDEGGQQPDTACGAQTQPGHAGLCEYDAFYGSLFYLDGDAGVLWATLPLLFRWNGFRTEGKTQKPNMSL